MLKEELNCETVFTIPIGKGIPVFESVAVTWVIMAVLVVLSLILVRNLKVENPGKKQLLLEAGIGALRNFFRGILAEARFFRALVNFDLAKRFGASFI